MTTKELETFLYTDDHYYFDHEEEEALNHMRETRERIYAERVRRGD